MVKCEERYNKSKTVHLIMRHVAEKTQTPIETLYESIAWPLNRKFGHAIDAFKLSITYVSLQARVFLVNFLSSLCLSSSPLFFFHHASRKALSLR